MKIGAEGDAIGLVSGFGFGFVMGFRLIDFDCFDFISKLSARGWLGLVKERNGALKDCDSIRWTNKRIGWFWIQRSTTKL